MYVSVYKLCTPLSAAVMEKQRRWPLVEEVMVETGLFLPPHLSVEVKGQGVKWCSGASLS